MKKAHTWLLLKEGFNAQEIAAAAGVGLAVALGMMNEATPRSARHINGQLRLKSSSTESAASTATAGTSQMPRGLPITGSR